jgi:hypothetical protein
MTLAVYEPSASRAIDQFCVQCVILGALAVALCACARQRHGTPSSVFAVITGILAGLAFGVYWVWRNWTMSEPSRWQSREQQLHGSVVKFFELWRSAIAEGLGLLAGWLALEAIGATWRLAVALHSRARPTKPGA